MLVRSEGGFSLIELMISMGLGVFLSSVMVLSYVSARQSALYDEQIVFLQENARFALDILSRELSLAGFQGALGGMHEIPAPDPDADCASDLWALNRAIPLQVADDYSRASEPETGDGELLACLDAASVVDATDVFAVRRSASTASVRSGVPVPALVSSTTPTWFLRVVQGVAQRWEKQRPRDLQLIAQGSEPISFWEVVGRILYIREFSQSPQDQLPALCMKTLAGSQMTTRCLVEGVENLQLQFGLDTDFDGVANLYRSGLDSSASRQAVTARVHLLMRSAKAVSRHVDENSYRLGEVVVPPPRDRHIRRVFTATFSLANLGTSHG